MTGMSFTPPASTSVSSGFSEGLRMMHPLEIALCAPDHVQVTLHSVQARLSPELEKGIAIDDGVRPRAEADLDLFTIDSADDDNPHVSMCGGDTFDDSHDAVS